MQRDVNVARAFGEAQANILCAVWCEVDGDGAHGRAGFRWFGDFGFEARRRFRDGCLLFYRRGLRVRVWRRQHVDGGCCIHRRCGRDLWDWFRERLAFRRGFIIQCFAVGMQGGSRRQPGGFGVRSFRIDWLLADLQLQRRIRQQCGCGLLLNRRSLRGCILRRPGRWWLDTKTQRLWNDELWNHHREWWRGGEFFFFLWLGVARDSGGAWCNGGFRNFLMRRANWNCNQCSYSRAEQFFYEGRKG